MTNYESRQLDESGRMGPLMEICLQHAERTFKDRLTKDTSPTIVQMILFGEKVPHWYYRSEEWVDQPYFVPREFLQPYRGSVDMAPIGQYGPGTYEIDEMATQIALHKAKGENNPYHPATQNLRSHK